MSSFRILSFAVLIALGSATTTAAVDESPGDPWVDAMIWAQNAAGWQSANPAYCLTNEKTVAAYRPDGAIDAFYLNPTNFLNIYGFSTGGEARGGLLLLALHETAHAYERRVGTVPPFFGPSPPYVGGPYNTVPPTCGEHRLVPDAARKACELATAMDPPLGEEDRKGLCKALAKDREVFEDDIEDDEKGWDAAGCNVGPNGEQIPAPTFPDCGLCQE